MLNFNKKKGVFEYIKNKFYKECNLILIRGSTTYKPAKKFSDFDVEVYSKKIRKPYYEIIFLNRKPMLISAYFYKYKEGKKIQKPQGVKVLYGEYNNKIKPDFSKDVYTNEEKIKRECQLLVDFFFKYLRNGNKKYLKSVQKRL